MSEKYPILKPNEIISALSKKGFVFKSQKGSHAKYTNGRHITVVPIHGCSWDATKYFNSSRNRARRISKITVANIEMPLEFILKKISWELTRRSWVLDTDYIRC
jgi:predicted RNA binding protein YcfA (HicA-like mRNA interferase family)